MILAIVGATGLVGSEIIKILEDQNNQHFKETNSLYSKYFGYRDY